MRNKIDGKRDESLMEQIYRTMGLISADRRNKATLLLTIPCRLKIVYDGFTLPIFEINISRSLTKPFCSASQPYIIFSWTQGSMYSIEMDW
jgi:hypothetical protein